MENCIFCKIIKGEIPCIKIYEDEKIISFLDINPFSKGHLLIIPKEHSRWLWDMTKREYIYLKEKTYFIANNLRKIFETEWIEEVVAGVGVEHTHIHLLPRSKNDGLPEIPIKPLNPKPTKEEMQEMADKIKNLLKY